MEDNTKLILFGDLLSQPTRAVYWFLLFNKINFEFKPILFTKMEPRSEEYSKINPFKKVPAIEYKNKVYVESHTILRFLAQEFKLEKYYGPTLDDRVNIDTYLDWHHLGLRRFSATLFFYTYAAPLMKIPINETYIKDSSQFLPIALNQIETIFLKNGQNKFISGDQLTIADFSCYCELKQLDGIKYDFSPYKSILEWRNRMESLDGNKETNVAIDEVVSKQQ